MRGKKPQHDLARRADFWPITVHCYCQSHQLHCRGASAPWMFSLFFFSLSEKTEQQSCSAPPPLTSPPPSRNWRNTSRLSLCSGSRAIVDCFIDPRTVNAAAHFVKFVGGLWGCRVNLVCFWSTSLCRITPIKSHGTGGFHSEKCLFTPAPKSPYPLPSHWTLFCLFWKHRCLSFFPLPPYPVSHETCSTQPVILLSASAFN